MTEFAFRLPSIGSNLVEAEIVTWLVQVGEEVAKDQPLVEVETEKSTIDLASPLAGTLLSVGAEEGERLRVGDVLAVIDGDTSELSSVAEAPTQTAVATETPVMMGDPALARPASAGGGVRATPQVRRLARELGVDVEAVPASGPGGVVTGDDVRAAAG